MSKKTESGENARKHEGFVSLRPKPHKKHRMTDAELDAHPDMARLRQLLKTGALDRERTLKFLKEGDKR